MALLLSLTFGLVLWIILWAIGVKGFDAFLPTLFILLIAVVVKALGPVLPGNRED